MAETHIAKTTNVQQPAGTEPVPSPGTEQPPGVFQRYFDSIQVACDPQPPLWPDMETPEAAELREAQGLPPPRPWKHEPYDHSRKEAAAAGPHRQEHRERDRAKAEAERREAEAAHKASTPRR